MTLIVSLAISIPIAFIFLVIGLLIRRKNKSNTYQNKISSIKNEKWILKEFLANLEYVFYFLSILFLIAGIVIGISG